MLATPQDVFLPFLIKAAFTLMMLGGLALVVLVAILAIVKGRPGIAAFLGGLVLLGLLIPASLVFSYVSMRSGEPGVFVGHQMDGRFNGSISFLGILVIVGVVIAAVAGLSRRRSAPERAAHRGGTWWPVLLLLPLGLLFLLGTLRVQRSAHFSHAEAGRQARMAMNAARQQDAIARRAAEMNAKIVQRIDKMDINELMDRFDAPRIVLPTPPAAMMPLIAFAPQRALGSKPEFFETEHESEATFSPAQAEAEEAAAERDPQLEAEAAAAVELVAAEADAASGSDESPASAEDKTLGDTAIATEEHESQDHDVVEEPTGAAVAISNNAKPATKNSAAELSAPSQGKAEAPTAGADIAPQPLSTPIAAPAPNPDLQAERPAWAKYPPKRVGQVQREVVVTDEWSTEQECEQERDIRLMLKTYEHVQQLSGAPYESQPLHYGRIAPDGIWPHQVFQLQSAGITLDYVRREIAKDEYLETTDRSVGPMKKLYTLVEFTPPVDQELRWRWDAYRRRERLSAVSLFMTFGAGGILGLLGLTYGLLKVDTWTKGYYTKRLFLGVPAAIIGVLALLALMIH